MTSIPKKVAVNLVKKVPTVRRYLDEKKAMGVQLLKQHEQITQLRENKRINRGSTEHRKNQQPYIRFITNQLDATGAPLIFMEVAKDFIKQHPKAPVDFTTFTPTNNQYVEVLKSLGFITTIHDRRDVELDFVKGDVVILNTVAHETRLKNSIYNALEAGIIKKFIWYMHEDWPEIFFDEAERQRIRKLLDRGKVTIFLPAVKALNNHQKLYGGKKNLKKLPYRIIIPGEYYMHREPEEFDKLTFIMVGKTGEGLKGHLPILYAFLTFKRMYYDHNPKTYRDFELRFMSIEADYLSLQILRHAPGLGKHFKHYPPLPHDEALDVIRESNITICYSMRECLPIFVFEGMATGHPILRNDVSGMEEQLVEGENGWLLDSNNYDQVVETIEKVLNHSSSSNDELAKMSHKSHQIAKKQGKNSYEALIRESWKSFT